jgi:hypothetical protein
MVIKKVICLNDKMKTGPSKSAGTVTGGIARPLVSHAINLFTYSDARTHNTTLTTLMDISIWDTPLISCAA